MRYIAALFFALTLLAVSQDSKEDFVDDPFAPLPPIKTYIIQCQFECIEVSHTDLTKMLFFRNQSHADATELRKELQNMVAKDQAKVVDTMMIVTRSGQKATMESSTGKEAVNYFGCMDFGCMDDETIKTVRVIHDIAKPRSFALEADCKEGDDHVIFYLPAKPTTFEEACISLNKWKNAKDFEQADGSLLDRCLQEDEEIRIPYVTLHCSADFKPLLNGNRTFANSPVPFFISKAQQTVFFQLDEKGATARVTVDAADEPFAAKEATRRMFHFNKPFYVFLWRKKAEWPYMGIWLGDTTAMKVVAKKKVVSTLVEFFTQLDETRDFLLRHGF